MPNLGFHNPRYTHIFFTHSRTRRLKNKKGYSLKSHPKSYENNDMRDDEYRGYKIISTQFSITILLVYVLHLGKKCVIHIRIFCILHII